MEAFMMRVSLVGEVVNRFKEGLSCSQAIFVTYGKQYGIDEKIAKTISSSFGGGMGRTCQTCGAVTGAYMVLGFINHEDNDKLAKEKTYALVQAFSSKFNELHGSVNCQQLTGCDFRTTEGKERFKANNLSNECMGFVRDSALILEELIKAQK
jgi:C_GCAxxG_C_C family probable redox protein